VAGAALTKDDGGLPVEGPIAILAGLAGLGAAAYFGWISSLGRFLAGTALGGFLMALWRRRKIPGPPRQVRVQRTEDTDVFTWVTPRRPKNLDRYSIEGFDGESWLVVHEHASTTTLVEHPRFDEPVIEQWRITASNGYGTSKPSDDVQAVNPLDSATHGGEPPDGVGDWGTASE